jgi:release factor glutamine methyltransferase
MSSIAESLDRAEKVLATSGIAESRREAISLLTASIKRDKAFVYAHPEYVLAPEELSVFDSFLERRAAREPLQYITGVQEFYGLEFEVTPAVLIPRPETELLVERALEVHETYQQNLICEIGTGSGCIAVSILKNAKSTRAVGVDISTQALAIAERNAARHLVADRLTLLRSDLFEVLGDRKFEIIVSNPPYVPVADIASLQPEVRDFEPHSALTDGSDGLAIIRRIVNEAPEHLSDAGHLMMEIGYDQSEQVASLFDPRIWTGPHFVADLQGIQRVVFAGLK